MHIQTHAFGQKLGHQFREPFSKKLLVSWKRKHL